MPHRDLPQSQPAQSPPALTVETAQLKQAHRAGSDLPFLALLGGQGGSYILLIFTLLAADVTYTSPAHFAAFLEAGDSVCPACQRPLSLPVL